MIEFLVIYFAIGCELALIFFLISFFIEKMQDIKLLAIYCVIMLLFWPVILVKIIIDIIKNKIANNKKSKKQ